MKRSFLTIAAACGALLAVQPAFAASVEINYKDLDLNTVEGRQELDQRVDKAARQICGLDGERTGTRITSPTARKCYKEARKGLEKSLAAIADRRAAGG